jgi:hypothetical protein
MSTEGPTTPPRPTRSGGPSSTPPRPTPSGDRSDPAAADAKRSTRRELCRIALPLRLLLPRRGLDAGGAGRRGGAAGLSGPRPDRPRRRLGGDGVRAGGQGVRRSPDRRRRADRDCWSRPLSPDAPRRGCHRVAEPVPPGHGGSSRYPSGAGSGASPPHPAADLTRAASGGPGLPLGLRAGWSAAGTLLQRYGARGGRGDDAGATLGGRLRPRSLPGRAAAAVLAVRPARNRWLEDLAGRLGVPCVATGGVHMHDPSRAPLQDARSPCA